MEVQIDKEKDTPLLSRKRVTARVYYEGSTPSRVEALKEFSKKMKVKPEKVIVKHMYTRFGQQYLKLIANVYKDTDALKKLESSKLVEKHKPAWEEKKEEGATEEKDQEKQDETTSEETSTDEQAGAESQENEEKEAESKETSEE